MVGLLSRLPWTRRAEVIVECRHCGTTVESRGGACPTCDASGFAEYRIPG